MCTGFRMFKIGQVILFILKEDIVQQMETEIRMPMNWVVKSMAKRERKAQFGWLVKFSQDR